MAIAEASSLNVACHEPTNAQKILVVDDSRAQRVLVRTQLKRLGFEVIEAGGGEEALELCQTARPDLIISDWMMPGMSGLDLCRAYRALETDRYGYFILLTSKSEKGDIAEGLDVGADDFLTKPFNPAEMRARVQAGLRVVGMERELKEKNRLVSATLQELQQVYQALDSDLIEARKLQQSLVRERFIQLEGADLSLMLKPAGHVGGDLVGAFEISATEVGFYSLDVSGHGVASALLTARLAGRLTGVSPEQNIAVVRDGQALRMRPPSDVVDALNTLMLEEMETEHYFTILLAKADLTTGRVILSQAGHPHPLIQRADGEIYAVGAGGLPVGLIPGADFDEIEVQMHPGDRLFLGSDGITECENDAGAMLEDEGLMEILGAHADVKGPNLLDALYWDLSRYNGDKEFGDDVSGVLFEYSGRSAI